MGGLDASFQLKFAPEELTFDENMWDCELDDDADFPLDVTVTNHEVAPAQDIFEEKKTLVHEDYEDFGEGFDDFTLPLSAMTSQECPTAVHEFDDFDFDLPEEMDEIIETNQKKDEKNNFSEDDFCDGL